MIARSLPDKRQFRASVLASLGASASEAEELLAYNENVFDHSGLADPLTFPLAPEPHVGTWERYAAEAEQIGAFEALRQRLVQLRFPIREGISQDEAYLAVTRRGAAVDDTAEATGLVLTAPERLRLIVHQSPAGRIPIVIAGSRTDFISLVQALSRRNEPAPVPPSMGACMVVGLNNWDRIREYRKQWEAEHPGERSAERWQEEFRRLIPQKERYQDRFIILSDGPYSDVAARDVGLAEEEWRRVSLTIRLEHECAHYFTRRLLGSMRNNVLDELIADYVGIVAAVGRYRADWSLRFMGLESFPAFREGSRLQNYRGQPPLSDGAFRVLQALVKHAVENLERYDIAQVGAPGDLAGKAFVLLALTHLTLEELASGEVPAPLR